MNSDIPTGLEPADKRLQALRRQLLPIMLRIRIARIEISSRLIVFLSSFRLGLILVLFTSKLAYVEHLLMKIVSEEWREAGRDGQTLTWGNDSSGEMD